MTVFRLLVVEDDPELRSQLSRGLGEAGFEVEAVGDAAAAVARTGDMPDGLVIDIGLPDADGRDLCQALRARGIDAPGALPHRARRDVRSPLGLQRRGR